MCQSNLYLVPKSVPEEEVIRSFEMYGKRIAMSPRTINTLADSYNFYWGYGCDCNSIVSKLRDEEVNSFDEYKVKKKDEDIEKLGRMKILKASEDYEQTVEKFKSKTDMLSSKYEVFTSHIGEYTSSELERINSLNLPDEERSDLVSKNVYSKMNEMIKELENNKEYKAACKEYQDYLKVNADLWESSYYDIEKNEKLVTEYDFSDYNEEFNDLKNIYNEVLKSADEICLYPFWMDEEPMEIKGSRQVDIENLKIDDLVFLPYRNLLKISRGKK